MANTKFWRYFIRHFLIISGIVITIIAVKDCAKNCPNEGCVYKDSHQFDHTICKGYDCYCTPDDDLNKKCKQEWKLKAVCQIWSMGKGLGISIIVYMTGFVFYIFYHYIKKLMVDPNSESPNVPLQIQI